MLTATTHAETHILGAGIVIASLILNGVVMVHLLPYKLCEFSELPPLWILSWVPRSLSFSFSPSLHPSLSLCFSHSFTVTHWSPPHHAHTSGCMCIGHCYAAHVRLCLCLWSVHPQLSDSKIPDWSFPAHPGPVSPTQLVQPHTSLCVCVCGYMICVYQHCAVCLADRYKTAQFYVLVTSKLLCQYCVCAPHSNKTAGKRTHNHRE